MAAAGTMESNAQGWIRRLAATAAVFALGSAWAQTWEKRVAPGLTYREEVDASIPLVVHALRFSLGSPDVKAVAEHAESVIFDDNQSSGRETVSELVSRTNAIAGINGDYFPFTGKPLGAMVRNGEVLSVPSLPRAVFGWGPADSAIGTLSYEGSVHAQAGDDVKIDNFNSSCGLNEVVLDTETCGLELSKIPNVAIFVKTPGAKWNASASVDGEVDRIVPDSNDVRIPPGESVLVATGAKIDRLKAFHHGDRISFHVKLTGFDWSKIDQAIGGGPFLVRNSVESVDWQAEGFKSALAESRHPRTIVGRTARGDIWLIVIDGRSPHSQGATLDEAARVALRFGCSDAMNLDGGGSTTINLFGLVLNRPSDGEERKIANGVLLFAPLAAPKIAPIGAAPTIKLAAQTALGKSAMATVVDPAGNPIPNSDIVWAASGAGWIDQGGLFHPLLAGKAKIVAYVQGWTIEKQIVTTAAG